LTAGIKANVDGSAAIQVGGVDAITLTSAGAASFVTSPMTIQGGSAAAPSLTFSGDTNTGIFSPAADTIAFSEGGVESMRIDASGNLGIGTSSPGSKLQINDASAARIDLVNTSGTTGRASAVNGIFYLGTTTNHPTAFLTNDTERARIDNSGNLLVGTTSTDPAFGNVKGTAINADGWIAVSRDAGVPLFVNRKTNDGTLTEFKQDSTTEGTISVSGTTVSYNGGHLSRYAQTTTAKDESLVKGTVLSNLNEMNVYTDAEGNPVDNEQLNKVKVSDIEGDANVAGVFVNWTHDDAHDVDEINMAMTGDMIIRIAQGVTVQRGDLLMSAGDGTAKPQGDDIIRSKTVAKVTSTHVTCTYEDGSYCVPCVLMAC
jgi:hypothetical protein